MPEKGWVREHAVKTVIGTLIVLSLTALFPSVHEVLSSVPSYLSTFFAWLGAPVQSPRWWYWTLIVIASAVAVGIIAVIAALIRSSGLPRHHAYTSDTFFGVVWRWQWPAGRFVDSEDLTPYCPECDRLMPFQVDNWHMGHHTTYLTCEVSGAQIRDLIFYNNRNLDFLKDIYDDYGARQIVMEIKNVKEVEREHINQVNRYLNPAFGKFGIIVTRNSLTPAMFRNTTDLWAGQRKCILVLTDEDLATMVTVFESKQRFPIDVIKAKYVEFTRACPA
jgi:hypothetical protein